MKREKEGTSTGISDRMERERSDAAIRTQTSTIANKSVHAIHAVMSVWVGYSV